ncbi:N,N-dimethylformamidase beta subunit family domain-containing protein [Pseudonocardia yuanmonensis]|uniref:N,N-dimethylformamidase beta subunit family domain-containing protein n=1 Tax=Pseudonocardia yuanmonensis TaxID=1095914 RepID=UPI0031F10A89
MVVENQNPGSDSWQIGRAGYAVSDAGQVEGYASAASVDKGEQISLQVSVRPAQEFTADIYRMGWYGGLGARLMMQSGLIPGAPQQACTPEAGTGVIDCRWSPSYTLAVPDTWTSGVYLVVLTNAEKYQSYITFVVRDDGRRAALLFQQSVTTYQAYNNYPNDGRTGKSLYGFNSFGAVVDATNGRNAAKVSFDRPYADGNGSGQFAGSSWGWERYFIGWLEQSGYDVAYSTDIDTHANPARLLDVKAFLSVGHDEYWSKEMMDGVAAARDAGTDLGFFGSNTAYWQVRFEDSGRGVPNRVMVCFKSAVRDPVKGATVTTLWRDDALRRPEQMLVGVQSTAHLRDDGRDAVYVVQNSANWVWSGTGFVDGSTVPGILGYETDRQMPEYPAPVADEYALLSRSPVIDTEGRNDYSNSSIYRAPSGAWVFASGTNHWSYGLGRPGVDSPGIRQATANLLDRFLRDPG